MGWLFILFFITDKYSDQVCSITGHKLNNSKIKGSSFKSIIVALKSKVKIKLFA